MAEEQQGEQPTSEQTTETASTEEATRAGGNEAVLADLAAERDRRQAVEAELNEYRTAAMTEQERAIEEARTAARTEALSEVNERLVRASVREQAAGLFNDPADALAYLNLNDFQVDDNGDVDAARISSALNDLLTSKPYLGVDNRRTTGSVGQGPQGSTVSAGVDMNARIRQMSGRG